MAQQDFDHLVDGICRARAIARGAQPELFHMRLDGMACTLMPDTIGEHLDAVAFICDFGPPPESSRGEALQRLMETNLFMFGADTPRFACNPENGHVLYMGHVQLASINPESLLQMLDQVAQQAQQWNESYWLAQEPPPAKPSTMTSLRTGTSSSGTRPKR
jgi:hypothetical protein